MALCSVHSTSQLPKRSTNRTALHIPTTLQNRSIRNEKKGRWAAGGDVSRCTSTLSFIYLLQLDCHPVAVVILHVNKTWNWLLLDLSREGYMRSL